MLDPFFFIPFACLSAVLAAPILIDLRGKEKNAPILRLVTKSVARACASVAVMLGAPLIALNYPWNETWVLPQWSTVADAALLGLASATAAAALAALLLARLHAATVKFIFRVFIFACLFAWRFTPDDWGNLTIVRVMDWGVSTTALSVCTALIIADLGLLYFLARRRVTS